MVKRVVGGVLLLVVGMIVLAGCKKPQTPIDYSRPLAPGALALRKITDPALLPDFKAGFSTQQSDLLRAIDESLVYLAHGSSKKYYPINGITHEQAVASLNAFREVAMTARSPQELQQQIVAKFDVYESVGCDGNGTVLFTGYYVPILDGSRTKDAVYKYPLYRLPPDLIKDEEGRCLGRKLADGRIVPYPTRAEIEQSGMLNGRDLELVYLKDKFDAYICQIQGSAKIRLPDGQYVEVGYAGKNAAPYTSVSQLLVDEGKMPAEKRSLTTMRTYFREHPGEVDQYLQRNDSYVFFREASGGPFGSLNVRVTPYRSLATDKSIFPRGCVTYVVTEVPRMRGAEPERRPFNQFMLDQDTGGAIRAAGRADIFLGEGDEAGQIAGWTASEGQLYYLVVKSVADPVTPTASTAEGTVATASVTVPVAGGR